MSNDTQITANFIVARTPIQEPTKFELSINMKTAKVLGLDVPWQLQQLADAVIEYLFFCCA